MDNMLRRVHLPWAIMPALLLAVHCSGLPKKGDFPVTMSQVREGTPVYPSAPQPAPVASKRALPAANETEMEVAVIGGLNYRAAPGTGGKILGIIPYHGKVNVIDRYASADMRGVTGRWYKISYAGETGYVNSKYLREPGEARSMQVNPNRARKNRKKKTPEAITNIQR